MKVARVVIVGTAPLLQHRFPDDGQIEDSSSPAKLRDKYEDEWKQSAYVGDDHELVQPAIHIEESLKKAATGHKVAGKRGKTFKDAISAGIFVKPEYISHGVRLPTELDRDQTKPLYIDARPVRIQRARVMRLRLALSVGWRLNFEIEFNDQLIDGATLQRVLADAGEQVGIGDYRPRFGRFRIESFKVA